MKLILAFALAVLMCTAALADDAAIAYGGNPKMLSGHPSIRMLREHVILRIGEKNTNVNCKFVFLNEGAACNVRMGFPDQGDGSYITEVGEEISNNDGKLPKKVFGCLFNFRSWVDGKPVRTEMVWADKNLSTEIISWHTKTVHFNKGQTRIVGDSYSVMTGLEAASLEEYLHEAHYTLSTGASWKGKIGDALLEARFEDGRRNLLLENGSAADVGKLSKSWVARPRNLVYCSGFSTPTLHKDVIVFHRSNFRPTDSDDVDLYFRPTPNEKKRDDREILGKG